jgi:hypothetical protein
MIFFNNEAFVYETWHRTLLRLRCYLIVTMRADDDDDLHYHLEEHTDLNEESAMDLLWYDSEY